MHRVQRVPKTESQGRIHTSTATVAVLPEADEVGGRDQRERPAHRRVPRRRPRRPVREHHRLGRAHHAPAHAAWWCSRQDQKSQLQNKIARHEPCCAPASYEKMLAEQQAAEGAERLAQIGSGDRSEKIRTYNGPQDRVTDHRIGYNGTYNGVLLGAGGAGLGDAHCRPTAPRSSRPRSSRRADGAARGEPGLERGAGWQGVAKRGAPQGAPATTGDRTSEDLDRRARRSSGRCGYLERRGRREPAALGRVAALRGLRPHAASSSTWTTTGRSQPRSARCCAAT